MTTVAVDLLGGDGAPGVVADAVQRCTDSSASTYCDDVDLVVVGPARETADLLAARGVAGVRVVDAPHGVSMSDDPLAAVRENPDCTVVTAARLVADGSAQAFVSAGHTGASVAAAALTLGRIPGMTRPPLAVVMPALAGPVVLLDCGAVLDVTSADLVRFALAGWAYATAWGISDPRVGLLTIGEEDGKGDRLRRDAHEALAPALAAAGIDYVGGVEGHDVALGERCRVIVTDGFTGNVVLKALEGAVVWGAERMAAAYGTSDAASAVVRETRTSDFAGGMLLGVNGVAVVGHGAGTADEIAACIRLAARAVRGGLVDKTRAALSGVAT